MDNVNLALKSKIVFNFHTQAKFAKKVEESEHTISLVVNGKHELSDKSKKKWARRLKCEVGDIF